MYEACTTTSSLSAAAGADRKAICLPPRVHDHCWVAVKVDGRWRLLDVADATARRGECPFFVAPEHFRLTRLPLNAPWSLLPGFLSESDFFAQPYTAARFLCAGGRVLRGAAAAVMDTPAPKLGQALPVAVLELAVPPGYRCAQTCVKVYAAGPSCLHGSPGHSD